VQHARLLQQLLRGLQALVRQGLLVRRRKLLLCLGSWASADAGVYRLLKDSSSN
jgi:hypothetical protein